ncbi:MarR family winged helix-turn-helix transcriptional regulator [Salinarimonas rosea]|uniref:MarR family winged helix-turn-helix transcriptional regulator n=1 Tax=Salinarimonas rosea TaxID=552063 RepID=UPI000409C1E7|nr:MarR family transcriptional regulator [Salinarimonas rosea]
MSDQDDRRLARRSGGARTHEDTPTEAVPARKAGRPHLPEPPRVETSVDFTELLLHQVVGFATRFVQSVASTYTQRHGIGLPELRTLFLLGRHGRLAPIRLAELAATDRGTVTRALRTLTARGLVVVRADPDHGRRTAAQLTPDGAALHDHLARFVEWRNQWLKSHFEQEELATLLELLGRLDDLSRRLPTDAVEHESIRSDD